MKRFNVNRFVTRLRKKPSVRSTYGSSWQSLAMEAKKRDGFRCTKCGATSSLQVHHVIPLSRGGHNMLANLTTLCYNCHSNSPGHGHMKDSVRKRT